jgi:hypothetical protein
LKRETKGAAARPVSPRLAATLRPPKAGKLAIAETAGARTDDLNRVGFTRARAVDMQRDAILLLIQ